MRRIFKNSIISLQFILILCMSMLIFSACNKKPESATIEYIKFNENAQVEINETFDPMLQSFNNAQITKIEVSYNNKPVEVDDNYKFVAKSLGKYIYTIDYTIGEDKLQIEKVVESVDKTAPFVVEKPTQSKKVEVGYYKDFPQDLDAIKVDDNNKIAVSEITKQIVSITFDGHEYKQSTPFDKYLFNRVGSYQIKVALTDASDNVSYVSYTIEAVDTTAPIIQSYDIYYGWINNDGSVSLPEILVQEISDYNVIVSAKNGAKSLTVNDNKVIAQVGDEISLEYTVTDNYSNTASVKSILKVLENGVLLDNKFDNSQLLYSENAIINTDNNNISIITNDTISKVKYKVGTFNFVSDKDFASIKLDIINKDKKAGQIQLAVIVNGQEVILGYEELVLNNEVNSYSFDCSNIDINEVTGLILTTNSLKGIWYEIKQMSFVPYNEEYLTIDNLVKSYKVGEQLKYDNIVVAGDQISEITISIKNGNNVKEINSNEIYIFENEGDYELTFTCTIGNTKFTKKEKVTVSGTLEKVTLNGKFTVGKVGESYTLPQATVNNSACTCAVSVVGENVAINNNSFIPTISGRYIAQYSHNGNVRRVVEFAVVDKNSIDFEEETLNENSQFTINTDRRYVTSGIQSLKSQLNSYESATAVLLNPLKLDSVANAVKMDIYSSNNSKVKLEILLDTGIRSSGVISLHNGMNNINYLLGEKYNDSIYNENIIGIKLINESNYRNIFFIDNIIFTTYTPKEELKVFIDVEDIVLQKDEYLIVPNLLQCEEKYIQSIKVEIKDTNNSIEVSQGAQIALDNLGIGDKTIKYTAVDIYGKTHNKVVNLKVINDAIKASIQLDNYYAMTPFDLPQPTLSSEKYTSEQLSEAQIEKYYRVLGSKTWIKATQGISMQNACTMELMYTIKVGEDKILLKDRTYIHSQGVHMDFEKYTGGEHMMYYKGYDGPQTKPTSEWAYEGSYSLHMVPGFQWGRTCTGVILYEMDDPNSLEIGFEADTLVFWANSVADRTPMNLCIDDYDWKWVYGTEPVNIKKGVHKYIVKLDRPITRLKRFTFEIDAHQDFFIDNICFIKSADIEYGDIGGKQYYSGKDIEFTRPKLENISEIAFSAEDIANIEYIIRIQNEKEVKEIKYPGETLKTQLEKGRYDITNIIKIGKLEFSDKASIIVRDLDVEFIAPQVVLESNVEYNLKIANSTDNEINYKAYFKSISKEQWTELKVQSDIALINLTNSGIGEIKYEAIKGNVTESAIFNVLVRGVNSLSDFELKADGTHHEVGKTHRLGTITNEWSYDGNYSIYVHTGGHDFFAVNYFTEYVAGYPNGFRKIDGVYNAVSMRINAKRSMKNLALEIFRLDDEGFVSKWIKSKPINVSKGENTYIFEFDQSFSDIYAYGFEVIYNNTNDFYIDALYMYNIQYNLPKIRDNILTNEKIELEKIMSKDLDLPYKEVVKVKQAGESDYRTIPLVDGKYTINFDRAGQAEIKIEVTIIDTKTFTYNVDVLDESIDPSIDDMEWK